MQSTASVGKDGVRGPEDIWLRMDRDSFIYAGDESLSDELLDLVSCNSMIGVRFFV